MIVFGLGVLAGVTLTVFGLAWFMLRYGEHATLNDDQAQAELGLIAVWASDRK